MRVTTSNKLLSGLLKEAASQIDVKSTSLILTQILFLAKDGKITVKASGPGLSYMGNIDAEVQEEGLVTLPPEASTYMQGLGDCHIQLATQKSRLRLRRGEVEDSKFTPSGGEVLFDQYDPEEFPDLYSVDKPLYTIMVRAGALKRAVEATAFAAAVEEQSKPQLQCIRFSVAGDKLRLAAACNDSMAIFDLDTLSLDSKFSHTEFLLPAPACIRLASLLPDDDDILVEIGPNANQSMLYFLYTRKTILLGIFDLPTINFERMLTPLRANPYKLALNRVELVKALRRVLVFAKEQTNRVVIITIEPRDAAPGEPPSPTAKVTLYARTEQRFETEEVMRAIRYEGEPMEIGLNISRMLEILARFEGVTIELLLAGDGKPVLIFPTVNSDGQTALLMPLVFSKRPEKTTTREAVAA
jgi:DNA polymerase III sliding clamp (beta) subunit (PCNA family)